MMPNFSKLDEHWHSTDLIHRIEAPRFIESWLLDKTSLTAKLKKNCPKLTVQVLSEKWQKPLLSEALSLKLPIHQYAWVRCITLNCGEKPLVYARTVIPHCHAGNPWFSLKTLGNRPLGEILFQKRRFARTEFEFSKVPHQHWPYLESNKQPTNTSFARKCLFSQNGQALLLTEAFLYPQTLSH